MKPRALAGRASNDSLPKARVLINTVIYEPTIKEDEEDDDDDGGKTAHAYILLFSFRGINLINEIREYPWCVYAA